MKRGQKARPDPVVVTPLLDQRNYPGARTGWPVRGLSHSALVPR